MLQGEHSAILSTFIKLPFVIKVFVLSIFVSPFYIGFAIIYKFSGRKDHVTISQVEPVLKLLFVCTSFLL